MPGAVGCGGRSLYLVVSVFMLCRLGSGAYRPDHVLSLLIYLVARQFTTEEFHRLWPHVLICLFVLSVIASIKLGIPLMSVQRGYFSLQVPVTVVL